MAKVMFVTKGGEYFPPLGLMQISATAKQEGHEIYVGLLSKEDVLSKINRIRPDVVAYGGSTGEHKLYFNFNHELKKQHPEIITLMGGPHVTFFPEGSLKEADLDAVCIGEGDYAFPEFLNRVDNGRDFSGLKNIMTNPSKRPKLRPLIQDLDSLPFPDREIFYEVGEGKDNPIKHLFTSRGCPYNCTYCFNESFKKMYSGQKYVRKRSVDNILKEITEIKERGHPLKFIKFYDDNFTLKADNWLKEFSDKYPKKIGLPFFALMRADVMNEEIADLLQKAGCKALSMSIETANPELRKRILNRDMTNEKIMDSYKLCGERGIAIQSNNILGLPASTMKDDIATLDLNIKCKKQGVNVIGEFGTAHPYPGTALGKFCEENKLYDSKKGFFDMHMSYQDESPLNCFTSKEKRMQKNIILLGPVAVRFPRTRNLIVNSLIKLPTTPLYFAALYLTKTTGYMKYIYPLNYKFKDYLRIIPQSFKLDWFKRMSGEKWKKQK